MNGSKITCPTCKTNFEQTPDTCDQCGFPFAGSEEEKSIFIGQQIVKKGSFPETKNSIKQARITLWIIGAINILSYFSVSDAGLITLIACLGMGGIFIAFGFLTYKLPFASILIPLLLLISFYVVDGILDPTSIFKGIILKSVFIMSLIYALINIAKVEKLKKESSYLSKQHY